MLECSRRTEFRIDNNYTFESDIFAFYAVLSFDDYLKRRMAVIKGRVTPIVGDRRFAYTKRANGNPFASTRRTRP